MYEIRKDKILKKVIVSGNIVEVCDYKKPIITDYLSTKLSYVAN